MGAGPLVNPCTYGQQLETSVASFQQQNQATVFKVLASVADAVKILYKPLMAVVYVSSQAANNALVKSETSAYLAALAQVFGH
jgi:hypothetical protein